MSDLDHYNKHVTYSSIGNNEEGIALIMKTFAPIATPLLDLGCGTGLFVSQFDPKAATGVDFASKRVQAAKERYPLHSFVRSDFGVFLTGISHKYKTISMFEVLEHLMAPAKTLQAVSRHADRVIATVPLNNYANTHKVIYQNVAAVERSFKGIRVLHATNKNVFFEYVGKK